jgi:hypothetical protein
MYRFSRDGLEPISDYARTNDQTTLDVLVRPDIQSLQKYEAAARIVH